MQIITASTEGEECVHNLYRDTFMFGLGVKVSNALFSVQIELIIGIKLNQI